MVQEGVNVSHAGPVPAGRTGQHLGQAAGVVSLTVEPVVPKDLVICSLQPGAKTVGAEHYFIRLIYQSLTFRL